MANAVEAAATTAGGATTAAAARAAAATTAGEIQCNSIFSLFEKAFLAFKKLTLILNKFFLNLITVKIQNTRKSNQLPAALTRFPLEILGSVKAVAAKQTYQSTYLIDCN